MPSIPLERLSRSDSTPDEAGSKLVPHVDIKEDFAECHHEYDCQTSTSTLRHSFRSTRELYERCVDYLDKIWAIEVGGVVIAAASLLAIVGLLRYLDGLTLNVWTSRISPNTALSILVTISEAAMLASVSASFAQLRWCHFVAGARALRDLDIYDDASRGSWGSAVFFLRMTLFRKNHHGVSRLACFGALVTALAVVISPSAQQILEYRTTAVPSKNHEDAAMLPVSHGLSKGANILSDKQAWQAMYGGLMDFDYPIPVTCPSGNCTWPAFASLGVCSECHDELPVAKKQCLVDGNPSEASDDCVEPVYTVEDSNLVLSLKNGSQPAGSPSTAAKTYTLIKSVVTPSYPDGLLNSTLFTFLIAQLDVHIGTEANAKEISVSPHWNLTQCTIRWCSRAYKGASVVNGALDSPEPAIVELHVDSSRVCGDSLCQQLVTNDSSVMPQGLNANYSLILNPAVADIPNLVNFDYSVQAYENGTWDSSSIFSVTATMFLNTDIIVAIAKVCDAYTNRMRAFASSTVVGTVLITTTIIHIRWAWLTTPVALIAASVGFLAFVVAITRLRPQYSHVRWKNSSLPLISHPLTGYDDGSVSQRSNSRVAMAASLGRVRAQLRESQDGEITFTAITHHSRHY